MRKAFGYLRVSGESQVEGGGFDRQRDKIQAYASANDIQIVRWFEEEGVSGTIAARPSLQAMMVALMSNGVRLVLIEKLDRLARDLMVQEHIISDFRKHDFELISAHEPDLCIDDPTRKLLRQIMGAITEYDKTMLVARMRAGKQRKRLVDKKWTEGRKPFGQHPTKYKSEPKTLAHIKELRAKGLNYEQLARELNTSGSKTRGGGEWFPATIRRILLEQ
jgi:DNA invertase Pin-like site-specific DNA recombinase